MSKAFFSFYFSWSKATDSLTNEEFGRLVRSLLIYSQTGERPIKSSIQEDMAFNFIADYIEKINAKREHGKRSVKKRWATNGCPTDDLKVPIGDLKVPNRYLSNNNNNNITTTTNIKQSNKETRTRENVENSDVENYGCGVKNLGCSVENYGCSVKNLGCSVENSVQRTIPENFDEDVVEFFAHEGLKGDPRDFFAYNNQRSWIGVGGEDLLRNNTWQRYAYKYSEDVEKKELWRYNKKLNDALERKTGRRMR